MSTLDNPKKRGHVTYERTARRSVLSYLSFFVPPSKQVPNEAVPQPHFELTKNPQPFSLDLSIQSHKTSQNLDLLKKPRKNIFPKRYVSKAQNKNLSKTRKTPSKSFTKVTWLLSPPAPAPPSPTQLPAP